MAVYLDSSKPYSPLLFTVAAAALNMIIIIAPTCPSIPAGPQSEQRLIRCCVLCSAVAANIAVVGLALYTAGFSYIGQCPQLGLPMIFFLALFSQYMKNVAIPLPYIGR